MQNWEKYLNSQEIDEQQKAALLLREAEKLEQLAHKKELVTKFKGKDMFQRNEEDEIDTCYINAIKAKLAVLEREEQQKLDHQQ